MDELDQPRPSRIAHLASTLWKPLLGYWIYSESMTWFELRFLGQDLTISTDLQEIASLFMGALLALRMNSALNKWWEARALWGRLVNEERNLAAYVASLPNLPAEARSRMRDLLCEFPIVLMRHLRQPAAEHQPARVSAAVLAELQDWKSKGWIDAWEWSRLALVGESLLAVCGGCERIRNSPLIPTLMRTMRACAGIYLASAPLVLHCRPWTVPLVMTMAIFFFVIETISSCIDEPFGRAPEDIQLEGLCKTIGATVRQLLDSPREVAEPNP